MDNCPEWSSSYGKTYGYALAQLEIDASGQPLPMTETGYRSHFDRDTIEVLGGQVTFALAWLDGPGRRQKLAQSRGGASAAQFVLN